MQGERCRIWPDYEAEVHAGAHNEGTLVPFPDRFVNAGKLPLTLDS